MNGDFYTAVETKLLAAIEYGYWFAFY